MPPPSSTLVPALLAFAAEAAPAAADAAASPVAPAFGFDALSNYLLTGAVLFALGMLGFLSRRNLIVIFLSAEMMLQGVALTLVGFGRYHENWTGIVFTIVILTIAACEAAVALALVLVLYKRKSSLDVTLWQDIREPGVPAAVERPEAADPAEPARGPETYPHLTPSGIEPPHPMQPWERRRD
jgi:NADH-quinone oxidoreductase subunit K